MDIVARLRKQAHICWNSAKIGAVTKDRSASAMDEAAAEIERLRLELAGRDAEIAQLREAVLHAEMYLRTGREECPRCGFDQSTADLDATYELREVMEALGWRRIEAATAIASGEYRKGEG